MAVTREALNGDTKILLPGPLFCAVAYKKHAHKYVILILFEVELLLNFLFLPGTSPE